MTSELLQVKKNTDGLHDVAVEADDPLCVAENPWQQGRPERLGPPLGLRALGPHWSTGSTSASKDTDTTLPLSLNHCVLGLACPVVLMSQEGGAVGRAVG